MDTLEQIDAIRQAVRESGLVSFKPDLAGDILQPLEELEKAVSIWKDRPDDRARHLRQGHKRRSLTLDERQMLQELLWVYPPGHHADRSKALGEALGLSGPTVYNLLEGRTTPRKGTIRKLRGMSDEPGRLEVLWRQYRPEIEQHKGTLPSWEDMALMERARHIWPDLPDERAEVLGRYLPDEPPEWLRRR